MGTVLLAFVMACSLSDLDRCLAENTRNYRLEARQCLANEHQRIVDCIDDGRTEFAACRDNLAVCEGAADTVEARCRADRAEYRECRATARVDRDDYDALCIHLYGGCDDLHD